MATIHPRVSVTFEPAIAAILASLAEQEHQSLSAVTRELVLEALELREDRVLSAIAEKRDTKSKRRIDHDDAWE